LVVHAWISEPYLNGSGELVQRVRIAIDPPFTGHMVRFYDPKGALITELLGDDDTEIQCGALDDPQLELIPPGVA